MEEPDLSCSGGYMILLLESKSLFDKFHKEYWPNYETEGGKKRVSHVS